MSAVSEETKRLRLCDFELPASFVRNRMKLFTSPRSLRCVRGGGVSPSIETNFMWSL